MKNILRFLRDVKLSGESERSYLCIKFYRFILTSDKYLHLTLCLQFVPCFKVNIGNPKFML